MGLAPRPDDHRRSREIHRAPAAGVIACDRADGLAHLRQPETELVIWQRSLPTDLEAWLEGLDLARGPAIRMVADPSSLGPILLGKLDRAGWPPCVPRDRLVADIHALATRFAVIAGSERVDLRLEAVSDNACWKFHRDCVEARLLTTYRGAATEWVHPEHAEQALRLQQDYAGPLERLGEHDVALFKGSCAGPGSGIVHRSPPILGTGVTRLLLCLNRPTGPGNGHPF